MKILNSTKTLIAVAIMGLAMSLATVASGQPAPDREPMVDRDGVSQPWPDVAPEATESPVAASENPTDIAPTDPAPADEAPDTEAEEAETAPAAEDPVTEVVNPAKENPAGTADDVYRALKAGKWLVAFGGVLMFLVWLLRSLLLFFDVKWVKGELGGNVVAFGTAFTLAIAMALSAGQGLSMGLLSAALGAGWLAKGQWSHAQAAKAKKAESS